MHITFILVGNRNSQNAEDCPPPSITSLFTMGPNWSRTCIWRMLWFLTHQENWSVGTRQGRKRGVSVYACCTLYIYFTNNNKKPFTQFSWLFAKSKSTIIFYIHFDLSLILLDQMKVPVLLLVQCGWTLSQYCQFLTFKNHDSSLSNVPVGVSTSLHLKLEILGSSVH